MYRRRKEEEEDEEEERGRDKGRREGGDSLWCVAYCSIVP